MSQPRPTETRTSSRESTPLGDPALRQLALTVLAQRSESEGTAEGIAAAARRAYDELAHAATPLIGQIGVVALAARALHLAQQEHPWLSQAPESDPANEPFAQVVASASRQDPAMATEGTATVFATLAGLLVTFIGEALTMSLLRKAWPDAFADAAGKET
jgi:hypothetical protein